MENTVFNTDSFKFGFPEYKQDAMTKEVDWHFGEFGIEFIGGRVLIDEIVEFEATGFKLIGADYAWSLTGKFKKPIVAATAPAEGVITSQEIEFKTQRVMAAINEALGFNAFVPTVSRITGKTFLMPREV